MEREIVKLSAIERMRKRAADDDSKSLRSIYFEEMRQSTEFINVGYCATVESSLYKVQRMHLRCPLCRSDCRYATVLG